jgi:hypothetical protein
MPRAIPCRISAAIRVSQTARDWRGIITGLCPGSSQWARARARRQAAPPPAPQVQQPRYQHRPEHHVERNPLVYDRESCKATQDQEPAKPFPFPGQDQANHHRQQSGRKQSLWTRHDEWVRQALTHGNGGDEGDKGRSHCSGSPANDAPGQCSRVHTQAPLREPGRAGHGDITVGGGGQFFPKGEPGRDHYGAVIAPPRDGGALML